MTIKPPSKRDRYIPFSDAVHAVGISQTRVRNWLLRNLVQLDANEERPDTRKHRRFTELDVVRLGIAARLTHFGYSADEASKLIEEVFSKISEGGFEFPPDSPKMSERDQLVGALQTAVLWICADEVREIEDEQQGPEITWFILCGGDSRKRIPDDVRKFDTHLTIDIGMMVEKMWKRLEGDGLI